MPSLEALVALSRRFGSDPEWVLAGGGNTSLKDGDTLYVKASGVPLGTIEESGFCAIDRARLDAMWAAGYPSEPGARESAALADLMAARVAGEEKRPSVETLMHGLLPQRYVVHTHPAAVNGITCGREGEAACARLFGAEALWVPFVDPGYILAKTVRTALEGYRSREGRAPSLMLMQNHGLLVAGDGPEEIERLSDMVMGRVLGSVRRHPDLRARGVDARAVAEAAMALSGLGAGATLFRADGESIERSLTIDAFAPLASAFTPDHIVYAGHRFLLAEPGSERIGKAWAEYVSRDGAAPRIVLVQGLGAFACASNRAAAEAAMALYVDACKVAAYAESFGGALHMAEEKIEFIRNWEVERYRSSVSAGGGT